MEGYTYRIISIEKIAKDFPFATRYRFDDQRLRESVARLKIQNPLVVTQDGILIAGHKRLIAAEASGIKEIPVFKLQNGPVAKQDLFLLALLFNWNQFSSEVDRVWSIRRAKDDFLMNEEAIIENVLPVLGLAADEGVYQRYLKMSKLNASLLDLIAAKSIPFRGAHTLLSLSPADQDTFAHSIARKAALTTNQLLQAGEWLSDLLRLNHTDLESYLKTTALGSVLDHPHLDRRGRAERFCQAVRALRFPLLVEREKKFQTLAGRLQDQFDDLAVRAPTSFEEEGITLSVRVRNSESLAGLLAKIESRYPLLHSLFDVLR